MSDIRAALVKELREQTGVGMMDCKKALVEAGGDVSKAQEILRKKGLAAASKKSGRMTTEGIVGTYIHLGGQIGVLLELNCETDFVARNEEFQTLVKDVAMQIAASSPLYVSREDVPTAELDKEREILAAQADLANKPDNVREKIIQGRLDKFYEQNCLMDQAYIKDPSLKIKDLISQKIAKVGENISIRRFTRYTVGETLENK